MRLVSPALFLGCLALSSACLAQNLTWVQVNTSGPSQRSSFRMVYDTRRGRTVLFGGWNGNVLNDTWEWDGRSWTQPKPKTVPPARSDYGLAYDSARGRTVMFGGFTRAGVLSDTWEWDGVNWTNVNTKNTPAARSLPNMTHHLIGGKVLMFGGFGGGYRNDTWTYDGKDWTQLSPKTNPPPRVASAFAFQLHRAKTLLFGGQAASGLLNDTWEWDGKDWTQLKPKTSPSPRWHSAFAYNMKLGRVFVFGGRTPRINETWEWDGTDWARTKVGTSPSVRGDVSMAFDRARNVITLFGGWGSAGPLADTWELRAPTTLTGRPSTISIATGGTQSFALDAGTTHANRLYWIFGSVTGTSPGVTLASAAGPVNIPINPDFWTDITIGLANTALLTKTRGTLDGSGKGSASFNVPKIANSSAVGVKFYHAYLVYDANSNFHMASNPVELMLVK